MKNKIIIVTLSTLFVAAVLGMSIYGTDATETTQPAEQLISAEKANEMIKAGEVGLVLDARTVAEYKGLYGHIEGAKLIPHTDIASRLDELMPYKDKVILVYCHSGVRSDYATNYLKSQGFTKALDIAGGIVDWNAKGLKTVK